MPYCKALTGTSKGIGVPHPFAKGRIGGIFVKEEKGFQNNF
jgi:hypothetical protein